MTLANRITLVRVVLVPVLAALIMSYTSGKEGIRILAVIVYGVAALSDALDGFVARAYDQKTRLGTVLDPLADKLLINVSFVFLAVNREFATPLPAWFPVIILGRDFIIVVGSYLINEYFGPLRVRPRISGKLTTLFQMGTIAVVLLEWRIAQGLIWATLAISIVSFFDYMYTGIKQIGNEDAT